MKRACLHGFTEWHRSTAWLLILFFIVLMPFDIHATNNAVTINRTSCMEGSSDGEQTEVRTLLEQARRILYQNPGEAKIYAQKGIIAAGQSGDERSLASLINILGIVYDLQARVDSAEACYTQAYELYSRNKDYCGMVKVLNNLGIIMHKKGMYDKALEKYDASIELLKKEKCEGSVADAYINIGLIYKEISEYQKSLAYFLKAQEIYEQDNNEEGLVYTNINLGTIYVILKDSAKSLSCFQNALSTAGRLKDSVNITTCLNNIAGIYSEQRNFARALEYNFRSLSISEKVGDTYGNAFTCFNIGDTYYKMNKLESASRYMSRAMAIFIKAGDRYNIAKTSQSLGQLMLKQGNYANARARVEEALKIGTRLNSKEILRDCYFTLATLDSLSGNYAGALNAFMKYTAYKDSIFNLQKSQQIAEINIRYETESNQKQLELLKKENEISKMSLASKSMVIYLLLGGLALIIAISVLINMYMKLRSKKKITELTLRNLRQQMNPHFIFNMMNSVVYSLQNNEKERSFRYLHMLSKLMRRTLENSQYNEITLREELETLMLYIDLEALRLKDKFTYELRVSDELDQDMCTIPTLLLQPFVENSIWHGLSGKENGGVVRIDVSREGRYIRCRIEDNGIGRAAAAKRRRNGSGHHQSKGIAITDSRLRLINSVIEKDLTIHYTDLVNDDHSPAGTSVEIYFPYHSN